ncbi:N-glycosyltransferase [Planctomycetes bacterium CA13]|uniref:N-glycosyltransferase n=1 Tax=Novipirellula herctigrandis TaxID=2527986 RepID=A0A5C5Z4H4_9BACT|nr:N-glycosyltransferase [Planctomycetes bacterium CA13]
MTNIQLLMGILAWIATIAISVPLCLLSLECLLGAISPSHSRIRRSGIRRSGDRLKKDEKASRPSVDVVVPAHNEQEGLASSLNSLFASLRDDDRVYVVADNCTDATASIARKLAKSNESPVQLYLLERFDDANRGKDYALRCAFDVLDAETQEDANTANRVVMIVDADCQVDADAIDHLASQVARTGRPAQASYMMRQPAHLPATASRVLLEFAFTIKNHVRPLGVSRLGGACTLFGSGMAFPRDLVSRLTGPGGHLVEDMRWTFDMVLAGRPVGFCPDAKLVAMFPTSTKAADTQHRRWEHGHLQLATSQLPRLIGSWMRAPRWYTVVAALDLMIVPLSLLVAASLVVSSFNLVVYLTTLNIWPMAILAISLAAASVSLIAAWCQHRPGNATFRMLLGIPAYAFRKLPLYTRFLFRPERSWIRTDRS